MDAIGWTEPGMQDPVEFFQACLHWMLDSEHKMERHLKPHLRSLIHTESLIKVCSVCDTTTPLHRAAAAAAGRPHASQLASDEHPVWQVPIVHDNITKRGISLVDGRKIERLEDHLKAESLYSVHYRCELSEKCKAEFLKDPEAVGPVHSLRLKIAPAAPDRPSYLVMQLKRWVPPPVDLSAFQLVFNEKLLDIPVILDPDNMSERDGDIPTGPYYEVSIAHPTSHVNNDPIAD